MTGEDPLPIGEGPDAEGVVAAYLKAHPQFFVEHPAVLAEIAVPHLTGDAVSLVERQVAALREQYRRLENKYRELLTIAAENDDLRRRLHQLTIKLLGTDDIKATIATLYQALLEDFRADFVTLKVFAAQRPANGEPLPEFLGREAAERDMFAALIAAMHPLCGNLESPQRDALFGAARGENGSAVLLPLARRRWSGVLGVGSFDPRRYDSGMGVDFLAQLAEVVSQIIDPWIAD
ncbi:MAG: DUF484 family protein [Gammaproteobacteria bacterium]